MYDTHVTIVGNALHNPQWRKTANTGAMVTTFKIASTARRVDRESGRWVDGNSLRVRVTCWRSLAENVKNSVTSGDPLIVTGRLFTRDWEDESGAKRIAYELEASSVGHDLSRGRAVFERIKSNTSTSAIEDAEADQRIGGELTEPVPDSEAPTQFNDMPFQTALDAGLGLPSPSPAGGGGDPVRTLRQGGFTADPVAPSAVGGAGLSLVGDETRAEERTPVAVAEPVPAGPVAAEPVAAGPVPAEPVAAGPVPAEPVPAEAEEEPAGNVSGGAEFEPDPAGADRSGPEELIARQPLDESGSSGRRRGLRRSRAA